MNSETRKHPRVAVVAVASTLAIVIAQWALAFASVLSCLLPIVLVGGAVWAAQGRRWSTLLVILGVSPLSLSFTRGLAAYGDPDAYMMSVGLQHSGATFIDTHTRLPVATSGCLVDGDEWVRHMPYNLALHLATAVAGPPPGTYDGPIPAEHEARDALQRAEALDWRELAHDRVSIHSHRVSLQQWLGPALMVAACRFDPLHDDADSVLAPNRLIWMRLWMDRILLIELRDPLFPDVPGHVAVVAADSGRLIGHFPGPQSTTNFPLAWRPIGPRTLDMDFTPQTSRP